MDKLPDGLCEDGEPGQQEERGSSEGVEKRKRAAVRIGKNAGQQQQRGGNCGQERGGKGGGEGGN